MSSGDEMMEEKTEKRENSSREAEEEDEQEGSCRLQHPSPPSMVRLPIPEPREL